METIEGGRVIGDRYVVTELLGVGGMGHVYHARHIRIPEFEVALKVLDPGLAALGEFKEKFRNEVLAGYRANHPNVVRTYEYFDLEMMQAFAMEYVDAGTLHTLMHEGALELSESLWFISQIAAGLAALHSAGTYHRDLKPENVLVASDGTLKLTDFGVARVRGGAEFEMEGMLAGTPKYVAPEYVSTGTCDHRGDIYSLGVLAYELLSGHAPFKCDTRSSLLKERLEPHGLDLRERVPNLPDEVQRVVERCLSVNPQQRYPRASDIVEDIVLGASALGISFPVTNQNEYQETRIIWSDFVRASEEAAANSQKSDKKIEPDIEQKEARI